MFDIILSYFYYKWILNVILALNIWWGLHYDDGRYKDIQKEFLLPTFSWCVWVTLWFSHTPLNSLSFPLTLLHIFIYALSVQNSSWDLQSMNHEAQNFLYNFQVSMRFWHSWQQFTLLWYLGENLFLHFVFCTCVWCEYRSMRWPACMCVSRCGGVCRPEVCTRCLLLLLTLYRRQTSLFRGTQSFSAPRTSWVS